MKHYSYIKRLHHDALLSYLTPDLPKSVILSVIVGAGKTTLVLEALKELKKKCQVFTFSGDNIPDIIRVAVAELHSREFAYRGIMQSTGVRKRDIINQVIEELIQHGYLYKKKPVILEKDRRSYLSIYTYCDLGIVSYLSSNLALEEVVGTRVEGIVHTRIADIQARIPLKTGLGYYKPYSVDRGNKLKFLQGKIDFLFSSGNTYLPVEVKSGMKRTGMDLKKIKQFIEQQKSPFGIVFYGGMPFYQKNEKLLFWPYWLL